LKATPDAIEVILPVGVVVPCKKAIYLLLAVLPTSTCMAEPAAVVASVKPPGGTAVGVRPVALIDKPTPVVMALALIAIAVPVVRELELIFMVVAAVVDASSIWKPTPAVVRAPLRLNRTIPLVGAAAEEAVTKRAFPAPVSATPVVIDSPVPVVRAVALIAIDVPDVSELELIFMVVARVVDASSIWKALPAVVRAPEKLKRTKPLVGVLVEASVTSRAVPVCKEVLTVMSSPVPVVRALELICIALPVEVFVVMLNASPP